MMKTRTRIMYLESRTKPSGGYARIGKVQFSLRDSSILYNGKYFKSLNTTTLTSNYFDIETGEEYWISYCKTNGKDRSENIHTPVYIDENIREEYWLNIRNQPKNKHSLISNF